MACIFPLAVTTGDYRQCRSEEQWRGCRAVCARSGILQQRIIWVAFPPSLGDRDRISASSTEVALCSSVRIQGATLSSDTRGSATYYCESIGHAFPFDLFVPPKLLPMCMSLCCFFALQTVLISFLASLFFSFSFFLSPSVACAWSKRCWCKHELRILTHPRVND